jgi:hypothetical protein
MPSDVGRHPETNHFTASRLEIEQHRISLRALAGGKVVTMSS